MKSAFNKLYEAINKDYLVGGSDAKITLTPKLDTSKIAKTSVPSPNSIKGKDKEIEEFDKMYQASTKEMEKEVKDESELEVIKRITKEAAYQFDRMISKGKIATKSCLCIEPDEKVCVKFWFPTLEQKEEFIEEIKPSLTTFNIDSHKSWVSNFHLPKYEKTIKAKAKLETDKTTCPNAVYVSITI